MTLKLHNSIPKVPYTKQLCAIYIIILWYQAIFTVHVEKLRAAALIRFKILVQSKLSSPPTQTYTLSKALSWQP